MADYNLGTARGVIEIEYKGDGAKRATDDLGRTKQAADGVNPALDKSGKAAGVAGLAIAGGFALAAKSAADFEAKMSGIAAVSGATDAELTQLRNKSLQLGKDTAFSAAESATAIEELVKAGVSVQDVMNGAADATVALAAAGGVSMPEAASQASNAMNQFNLAAKDLPKVADLIAGAANASAIDVGEFGHSLSQVGAVANLAGVSFEDTAAAIALMGNAGIKGSDAGTSLKAMLSNLQPETDKQKSLMRELGLVTEDGANKFYDAEGNLKSLSDVSGLLQKSLKGLTSQQKQAALQTIFGSDAIRASAILANNGSKGFDKMAASMGKVSAADVASKRMDNLQGSIEQMKGSLETAGIVIGTLLLPPLRDLVDGVTSALNAFLSLSPGAQSASLAVLGVVGVVLLLVSATVKYIKMTKALTAALAGTKLAFISTWAAALGPALLVIAAVAAIGVALFVLWKKSETFREIVLKVWDAIKNAAVAVANWFKGPFVNFFQSAWEAIKSGLDAVKGFFVSIWEGIKTAVAVVFEAIATVVRTYINIWKAIITGALAVIGAVWGAFWGAFGGVISAAFGVIVALLQLGWTIIKGVFLLALMGILAIARTVWAGIVAVFRAVWGVIRAVVSAGVNAIRAVIAAVFGVIKGITSRVWNGIKAVIAAVWGAIGGTVLGALNRVKGAISAAWGAVKSLTTGAWNGIKTAVSTAVGALAKTVGTIKDKVLGALSGAASWLYNAGRDIIQGLLNGIEAMLGKVQDKIKSVTSTISKFLPGSPVKEGPLRVLNRGYAGRQIVGMIGDGIEDARPQLERTVRALVSVPELTSDLGRVNAASNVPLTVSPAGASGARVAAAAPATTSRIVSGRLTLDPSGYAFIAGVAQDVYDDNDTHAGTLARMGGR